MAGVVSGLKSWAALCGALVVFSAVAAPADCAAQGRARGGGLPRVGAIKDLRATGLTVGCANYYFHRLPYRPEAADSSLVFSANSDGTYAWMNLGGRDVRLAPLRTPARVRKRRPQFNYRRGDLRVTVLFVRPVAAEMPSEDFDMRIRIILRRGRAVSVTHAVGYSDC